jgi:proteasome assembly chaperone (PAC2) family protein
MNYIQLSDLPTLRRPVLLLAFTGWVDAAEVSTTAIKFLVDRWEAKKFAELDPEEFYNFTRNRPQIQIEPDFTRTLSWPETNLYYHVDPMLDRDFVLMVGAEPNFKWRTFAEEVLAVCQRVEVASALSLGGVIADVPHTRPAQITTFTSDPEIIARFPDLGTRRSRYQGPTGIIGVLSDAFTRANIPFGNMRGPVPHYIAASPNPKVVRALLTRVSELYGLGLDLSQLDQEIRRFEKQVNEALVDMHDVADYVKGLEDRMEDPEPDSTSPDPDRTTGGAEELPSGEDIVRQFEEFLRERSGNQGDEPPSDPPRA